MHVYLRLCRGNPTTVYRFMLALVAIIFVIIIGGELSAAEFHRRSIITATKTSFITTKSVTTKVCSDVHTQVNISMCACVSVCEWTSFAEKSMENRRTAKSVALTLSNEQKIKQIIKLNTYVQVNTRENILSTLEKYNEICKKYRK